MVFSNDCFKGKTILVTGAGRGIGNAIAKELYRLGATVYGLSKSPETLAKLKQDCPNVYTIQVNLLDWDSTEKTLNGLDIAFDGIVNNAGTFCMETYVNSTKSGIDQTFDLNVKAPINVAKCLVPKIVASGKPSSIVNISSILAAKSLPPLGSYSASKAALNHVTRGMAQEFGKHKIRVNSVGPGQVETELMREAHKNLQEFVESKECDLNELTVIKRYPMRLTIIPMEDIVNTTLFLLSDATSTLTGQCLYVDAGFLTT